MDKIAIISDVHGNLEALKTVLKDIKNRSIKHVYCLGDIIAKGVHSHECIQLIKESCEVVLKGNTDEYFTSVIDISSKSDVEQKRIQWNKKMLSSEDSNYLRNLPFCHEFYMSGRLVRLFHATPDRIGGFVGNIDTLDNLYSLFLPSSSTISQEKADVIIYGHIHTGFMQRIYNRTIVNSGSVGNSIDVFRNEKKDGNVKNTSVANYVIISGNYGSKDYSDSISFELVSLPYDVELELCFNKENIEKESYEEELRNGKYRDMTKIYKSFEARGIDIDKI